MFFNIMVFRHKQHVTPKIIRKMYPGCIDPKLFLQQSYFFKAKLFENVLILFEIYEVCFGFHPRYLSDVYKTQRTRQQMAMAFFNSVTSGKKASFHSLQRLLLLSSLALFIPGNSRSVVVLEAKSAYNYAVCSSRLGCSSNCLKAAQSLNNK